MDEYRQIARAVEAEFQAEGRSVTVGGENWPEYQAAVDARLPDSLRRRLDREIWEHEREERYRGRQGMYKSLGIEVARWWSGNTKPEEGRIVEDGHDLTELLYDHKPALCPPYSGV